MPWPLSAAGRTRASPTTTPTGWPRSAWTARAPPPTAWLRSASETPKTSAGGLEVRHVHNGGAGRMIAEQFGAGSLLSAYTWLGGRPIGEILPGSLVGGTS